MEGRAQCRACTDAGVITPIGAGECLYPCFVNEIFEKVFMNISSKMDETKPSESL